ncbi:MAG: hypothetical protein PHI12_13830 [Dehalococcoidales bacterium]|nr:hypothetical protein [Dehalococcoidales bacterium]
MKLKIMIMALLLLAGIGSAVNKLPATEFVGDIDFMDGYYARNATDGFFNIIDYGAADAGDPTANRLAIQAAIDDASAYPNGIVVVPGGNFTVDKNPVTGYILRAKSNVTITGTGTIRVADGIRVANHSTSNILLFYEVDSTRVIENVRIDGITVDFNGQNNLVQSTEWKYGNVNRMGAMNAKNWTISHVTFKNAAGHHFLHFKVGDYLDVHHCKFLMSGNAMEGNYDHDHTSLYASMNYSYIHDNLFQNPPGTKDRVAAGITAFELHRSNSIAHNNIIEYYYNGFYIASPNGESVDNVVVTNNIFRGTHRGMRLYVYDVEGSNIGHVELSGNQVFLEEWNVSDNTIGPTGIYVQGTTNHNTTQLVIQNNFIVGPPTLSYTLYSTAIDVNAVLNLTLEGNTFMDFSRSGMFKIRPNSRDYIITGNTFVDGAHDTIYGGIYQGWIFAALYGAPKYFEVSGNSFVQHNTTAYPIYAVRIEEIGGTFSIDDISIRNNFVDGLFNANHFMVLNTQTGATYIESRGAAAPTAGYHGVGSIRWNTAPAANGTMGWICTTAGAPGTWKTWGAIAA